MMENRDSVRVEYLGHSCFRLTHAGARIVLDPYADGYVPGLPPLRTEAEFVYCSHEHDDHNAVDNVTLLPHGAPQFSVEELTIDHDEAGGSLRGKSVIRIFTFGTLRVAHMGDLGRLLTAEEQAALQHLDMVLMPVGGFYTVDAATARQVLDMLDARVTVLMHFRSDASGFAEIAHIDDALHDIGAAEEVDGEFTLDAATPKQTIIMRPRLG